MAVGNFTLVGPSKLLAYQGALNLTSASPNVFGVLVTTTQVPAANTDSLYSTISGNEATGTGYTAGGINVGSVALTLAAGTVTFTSAAVTWASSTITARYLYLVRRAAAATVATTDPLIGYVDLTGGGSLSSTNGNFTITPNAAGWFTFT